MKYLFILFCAIICKSSNAQCDKTIQFNCTKMSSIENGVEGKIVNCNTTISIRNGNIILKNDYNGVQTGETYSITATPVCIWKVYPANGKTRYVAVVNDPHENTPLKSRVNITASNGKIKIDFTLDIRQNTTIQYWADNYTMEK